MTTFNKRLVRLLFGLFLYSLGIVFTINAKIGYSPWDVFHYGLSKITGVTFGTASIIVGLIIVFITFILGEKIGLGTVLNMLLIGIFLDILMKIRIVPTSTNLFTGILMMMIGLIIISFASFFYIGSAFGAGPRDGLMVAINRKTGFPIGVCRGAIEISAALIGFSLGGMLGFGTVISALMIGFFVQQTFKCLKFDANTVKHETLAETFNFNRFIEKKS